MQLQHDMHIVKEQLERLVEIVLLRYKLNLLVLDGFLLAFRSR